MIASCCAILASGPITRQPAANPHREVATRSAGSRIEEEREVGSEVVIVGRRESRIHIDGLEDRSQRQRWQGQVGRAGGDEVPPLDLRARPEVDDDGGLLWRNRHGHGVDVDGIRVGGGIGDRVGRRILRRKGRRRGSAARLVTGTGAQGKGRGESWEIERNAIKPYACCGLTHATIDCGRQLAPALAGREIERAVLEVNPLTLKVADQRSAVTPLQGKFSLTYCAALALSGYHATETDFAQSRIDDERLKAIAARAEPVARDDLAPSAARMHVMCEGEALTAETAVSLGNPENPMTWEDMRSKFGPLVEPALGEGADALFKGLRDFDRPGRLAEVMALAA